MNLEATHTARAPSAIGPYSQAIKYGDLLFVSGQIPLDPASMKIVDGNVSEQAQLVLSHLKAILEDSGLTMANVIKTEVFLANMDDFKAVNDVYATFFNEDDPKPARQAFEVARLPLDAKLEISCIASYPAK
ncbi:MAG: 2-iminobutanoate/2-iminopropanoate deaminase [Chlamydiae bacterium]|nr:2-iminobutanoate/2-iminopropanoate deaminase [Chlamydiota bacterium]